MKNLTALISILFIAASVHAQTEVLSGVTRGKDYGVVYMLPKTEIKIDVKVTKVTYTPGDFVRYAERYLRLSGISGEPSQYWELNDVTVTSTGVPDSENTYFVKMKDKTVAPLMELTEDGIIKSINIPLDRRGSVEKPAVTTPVKTKPNPRVFLTEEILMANSTAKMAELTAKEIYNIRESRNALVRGQADNMPQDGEQLKLMLSNLDEQESAMLELFTGIKNKEEKTFTIKFTPDQEQKDEVIFRFSKSLGVLDRNNLAGEPVHLTLTDLKTVTIPEPEKKKSTIPGIAYNVPGKARVTITKGKSKFFDNDLSVTQFGIVEYLTPELFNKNSTIKIIFNPATGGLIKVDR